MNIDQKIQQKFESLAIEFVRQLKDLLGLTTTAQVATASAVPPVISLTRRVPRDLSHEKSKTWISITIGIVMLPLVPMVFFTILCLVYVPPTWAAWIAIPSGTISASLLYFIVLRDFLWIYVDGNYEVGLQSIFSRQEKLDEAGETGPITLPKGVRSIGGPGWRGKFFEKPFLSPPSIKVKNRDISSATPILIEDMNGDFYQAKLTLTVKFLRGRYSILGWYTEKTVSDNALTATAQTWAESKFIKKNGKDVLAFPEAFNKEMNEVLNGENGVSNEEIRCVHSIVAIKLSEIDEDAETKKRSQAKPKLLVFEESKKELLRKDPGMDPVMVNLLASQAAGLEITEAFEIIDIRGLTPGSNFHLSRGVGGGKKGRKQKGGTP